MKYHGWFAALLLAQSSVASCQDESVPRLLGTPDRSTELLPPVPRSSGSDPSGNGSILESELESLRNDLRSFHAASEEVSRTARDMEARSDKVSTQQRQEVLDLLTKIATQGISRKAPKEPAAPAIPVLPDTTVRESTSNLVIGDSTVDAFALGKVLFRSGDFVKAEQAFRKVPLNEDNRAMVKYLIATCQYRRMEIQEAMEGYKELASSDQDPVVRDFARSQLESIRWRREFDRQLDQLKKQRDKSAGLVPKPDDHTRK